jgi:hypothetical protein
MANRSVKVKGKIQSLPPKSAENTESRRIIFDLFRRFSATLAIHQANAPSIRLSITVSP